MTERRYMISDASKMVDVESHVLRYWEEELMIEIPRNEMGHRYYTDFHIEIMRKVKDLKERGFQLKAIKMLIPELSENPETQINTVDVMKDGLERRENTKMEQFEEIIGGIVSKALKENNETLGKEVSANVSDSVIKEIDYMMRLQDEREEERFRKFDEMLRNYQTGRKEIATGGKIRKLFAR